MLEVLDIRHPHFDDDGLATFTMDQLGVFRDLYPQLQELRLQQIHCCELRRCSFTPMISPFLNLTRLEVIECDLTHLRRLSLRHSSANKYQTPGETSSRSLKHIASIRPTLRYLQLQIWHDLDIASFVHMLSMLSACKELTTFEICGMIDGSDSAGKQSLMIWSSASTVHSKCCLSSCLSLSIRYSSSSLTSSLALFLPV